LPREPGRRDSRYAQLFTGPPDLAAATQSTSASDGAARTAMAAGSLTKPGLDSERLERLEQQLGELRAMVEELQIELQTRP